MILRIDADAALPVYEQIRAQVVRMVVAGTLEPGTRLPTIRQLASDLQVAKGTVAKAYALLEEGAVIETRGRRGSFTLPPLADRTATGGDDRPADLDDAADAFVVAARQVGVGLDEAIEALQRRWNRLGH